MVQQSTLKQLSELLGLSISTVSRALKDHPDISEKTKQRVKELATAMEYEPNSLAVQLRTRSNKVVGILIPTINNFFYDSFIAAVEEEARIHGYSVLIMQSRDDLAIEKDNLNLFRKNMVAGLFASISVATEDIAPFFKLHDLQTPVIFFDRVPVHDVCDKVCFADADTARIAAEAIAAKNKKNILALFGHPHLSITQKRLDAFRDTIRQVLPDATVHYSFPEQSAPAKDDTLQALDGSSPPDVVFCMGDLILIGVMYAIHERKLRVPEDIAVVSISNGLIPTMYDPKITHVETSGYKLGKRSFEQMLLRLHGEGKAEEVFVNSELVEGGSI
jgi:LacI family transcriptional regulator